MAPTLYQVLGYAQFAGFPHVVYRTASMGVRYSIAAGEEAWNQWANDRPDERDLPNVLAVLQQLPAAEDTTEPRFGPPPSRKRLPALRPMRQVRYLDTAYRAEQSSEVLEVCHIVAVGFVIADEPGHLTLAREDLTDGTWRDQLAIPKCAIVEMHEVRAV
jgi:hypothetical protein